jgi:hypothetical protein
MVDIYLNNKSQLPKFNNGKLLTFHYFLVDDYKDNEHDYLRCSINRFKAHMLVLLSTNKLSFTSSPTNLNTNSIMITIDSYKINMDACRLMNSLGIPYHLCVKSLTTLESSVNDLTLMSKDDIEHLCKNGNVQLTEYPTDQSCIYNLPLRDLINSIHGNLPVSLYHGEDNNEFVQKFLVGKNVPYAFSVPTINYEEFNIKSLSDFNYLLLVPRLVSHYYDTGDFYNLINNQYLRKGSALRKFFNKYLGTKSNKEKSVNE